MAMRTTFTRNSARTRWAADGTLHTAAIDEPRKTYDPVTGEYQGLIIDAQTTGYIESSINQWRSSPINGTLSTAQALPGFYEAQKATAGASGFQTVTSFGSAINSIAAVIERGTTNGLNFQIREPGKGRVMSLGFSFSGEYTSGDNDYSFARKISAAGPNGSEVWEIFASVTSGVVDRVQMGFGGSGQTAYVHYVQVTGRQRYTQPILVQSGAATAAADFFDAPGARNEYGPGLHTWQCAVRMSRDPGQPTVLGYADGRIYAENGRLQIDGPGTLRQPDGPHAPGDYVPFLWDVQFPGAAPDFALGGSIGDSDWWNGHLVDINPQTRVLRESEKLAWLAR